MVLVITGKGRGGEPGVLRRQVPQWLGLPEFRALVVGFEDASVRHGGEGALYVRATGRQLTQRRRSANQQCAVGAGPDR